MTARVEHRRTGRHPYFAVQYLRGQHHGVRRLRLKIRRHSIMLVLIPRGVNAGRSS